MKQKRKPSPNLVADAEHLVELLEEFDEDVDIDCQIEREDHQTDPVEVEIRLTAVPVGSERYFDFDLFFADLLETGPFEWLVETYVAMRRTGEEKDAEAIRRYFNRAPREGELYSFYDRGPAHDEYTVRLRRIWAGDFKKNLKKKAKRKKQQ